VPRNQPGVARVRAEREHLLVNPKDRQPDPDLFRQLIERELQLREVVNQLLGQEGESIVAEAPPPLTAPLSPRELEIIRLVATGATNQQIGRELRLSPGTVRNYNGRIFRKLGVDGRTQAAVRAIELGVVKRAEKADPRSATNGASDPASTRG
jgi:DNA-binding CsgD family transcriptional regulator